MKRLLNLELGSLGIAGEITCKGTERTATQRWSVALLVLLFLIFSRNCDSTKSEE
jgi:hypothetical protein